MRQLINAAPVALVLALAGCGGSAIDAADVEQGAKDALTKSVGQTPQSIECPDDLDAEVGASERCTLTDQGNTLGMTVTVTSVDGDQVNYDVAVDDR